MKVITIIKIVEKDVTHEHTTVQHVQNYKNDVISIMNDLVDKSDSSFTVEVQIEEDEEVI